MKYDDSFLNLIDKLAPTKHDDQPPSADLRALVMERAGLPPKRRFSRPYKPLLIAALIGTGLLVAAAAYYNVSDAFRGILQEQTSEGQSRPISSMAPIVDRSGTLVLETVQDQGVEVTVRGVVGDANGFKILVDVVDPSGEPLAIEQMDGSLSQGDIRFGGLHMRTDETRYTPSRFDTVVAFDILLSEGDGYTAARDEMVDDDPTDNRTSIIIDVETDTVEELVGKTLHLTLTDLMQFGVLRGTPVGMAADDLYDLVAAFPSVGSDSFRQIGYYYDSETQQRIDHYEMTGDSSLSLPLAPDLPGVVVTNAAVWNDTLFLRGTAPKPTTYEKILPNAELRNFETDSQLSHSNERLSTLEGDPDRVLWEIAFHGVPSLDALKGYALALEGGDEDSLHPLRRGEWAFSIPLDFENTTHTIPLDESFSVNGFTMHARELTLSPYYMRLHTAIDKATYEAMMHIENPIIIDHDEPIETGESAWEKIEETAVLTMKDGSTLELSIGGWGSSDDYMEVGFHLPVVIDPTQVERIVFGDLTIRLQLG